MTDPDQLRLQRVLHLVGDAAGKRVLDLACGPALFSAALANAGADVLGIEGRPENLAGSQLSSARLEVGDVRQLPEGIGPFDVVLCLGILYHLTAADAVAVLARLRTLAGRVIVDTHVSAGGESVVVDGQVYLGQTYGEPDSAWSSLDLQPSWWWTPESLDEIFRLTGWIPTPVPGAAYPGEPGDRRWYVLDAS